MSFPNTACDHPDKAVRRVPLVTLAEKPQHAGYRLVRLCDACGQVLAAWVAPC